MRLVIPIHDRNKEIRREMTIYEDYDQWKKY